VDITTDPEEWRWAVPEPKSWLPTVVMADPINVRFYSCSGLGGERIVCHLATFRRDSYGIDTEESIVAYGPGGFVF
jgi:hypothetical protein